MALYGIKDSANLTLFSKKTGKPVLYADYCNQTSLNMSADTVYAMKKTARAISWDTSKEGTLTTEMQVFDLRWIALLMGSLDLDKKAEAPQTLPWAKREIVTLNASKSATLNNAPKTDTATLYALSKDGITLGDEIDASTGFTVTTEGTGSEAVTTLTVTNGKKDEKYCIFYLTEVEKSRTFTVSGDKYPQGFRAVFDTMIRDTDQQDHFVQFDFKNLRPKSQMELTMSAEDVCTLSVEWDVLVDNTNEFFTFTYLDTEYEAEDNNDDDDDDEPVDITEGYTAVPNPTGNPSEQGWYEVSNGEMVLSVDTAVDGEKTYYTKNDG